MSKKLTQEEITIALKQLDEWKQNENAEIYRTIRMKDFSHSLLLVNAAGLLAEMADHHPDIQIQFNKVTFNLSTHDAGGLTKKDFDLAMKINRLLT